MGTHSLSFLALDFETANADPASVCQVGLAKVIDGVIVESTSWLVLPPTGLKSFEPRFIRLHGITPRQTERSGISWHESLEKINAIANGLPFVAHNASFDKTVYHRASELVGISPPASEWFDTLTIARRFITAPDYKLPTVAAAMNLPDFRHHQAGADAITCARIALQISQEYQLPTVQELWARPVTAQPTTRLFTKVGDLPAPNEDAAPTHPLYGHHVVVTGELDDIRREDFMIAIAQLGAQPQLNVTKKTTMLVVASYETFPDGYDPSRGTSKEKKASQYKEAGQSIEFVTARQALAYLQTSPEIIGQPASEAEIESKRQPETPLTTHEPALEPSLPLEPRVVEHQTLQPSASDGHALPTSSTQSPQSHTEPQPHPRPSPRRRPARSWRLPKGLVKVIAWTLIVGSSLVVLLLLLGITGATFFNPSDPLPFATWLVGMLVLVPIAAGPGILGVFLLRRLKRPPNSPR